MPLYQVQTLTSRQGSQVLGINVKIWPQLQMDIHQTSWGFFFVKSQISVPGYKELNLMLN